MRNRFVETLEKIARRDKRVVLLTGDLGFTVFESFQRKFPQRFFNFGVTEDAMISAAVGLARSGKIPLVYSIAPFITLRPFEQIRNDICMHNANVKIVGVGAGLAYASAGPSHHVLEDVAVLRTLPNMTIVCPADPLETAHALPAIIKHNGPLYLRLGKSGEPTITKTKQFKIGKATLLKTLGDVILISYGPILAEVVSAAQILEKRKIKSAVVNMSTIKPLDVNLLQKLFRTARAVFTIEEHSIIGGLGSTVAEYLAESNVHIPFKRLGIDDMFSFKIGSHALLRQYHLLDASNIAQTIMSHLRSYESA
ncbi:hypothetical protein C4564_00780 [Candidatus Microgenomates bacterium]|nr:MAG: hypothetical protein C4564_00780 [Candidatus Microgenomates bacterium]